MGHSSRIRDWLGRALRAHWRRMSWSSMSIPPKARGPTANDAVGEAPFRKHRAYLLSCMCARWSFSLKCDRPSHRCYILCPIEVMETEERNGGDCQPSEPEYFMQWRNGKRLRCVRVKDPETSNRFSAGLRKKMNSSDVDRSLFQPRPTRKPDSQKSTSPEKEDRCYMTRGSTGVDESVINKVEEKRMVWPKLYITLSSKEKEEDYMAMKGCKLPHRPKKRAKLIQRSLLLVSPGAWLTDMCQERYEVREKKRSKKRPRGLKAMGTVESDSE